MKECHMPDDSVRLCPACQGIRENHHGRISLSEAIPRVEEVNDWRGTWRVMSTCCSIMAYGPTREESIRHWNRDWFA
jgi:hypothetical protein